MRSVSQTRKAHAFKQRIHTEDFLHQSLEIQPDLSGGRFRRSVDKDNSDFLFFNRSSIPIRSYISKATLRVHLNEIPLDGEPCKLSVIQMLNGEDGVMLDSSIQYENAIDLDVTHAIQAWSLKPKKKSQEILKLQYSGCGSGEVEKRLHLQYFTPSSRVKRSQRSQRLNHRHQGRRRRKHLCRRKVMGVDLDDLGGFDFIVMPRYFNAALCSGKCPARFKPHGDHSLLQSLVSLRSHDHNGDNDIHVPTPCCSPAHYEGLDVLHIDDQDHSKLKVTHWRDVKVSQCACA